MFIAQHVNNTEPVRELRRPQDEEKPSLIKAGDKFEIISPFWGFGFRWATGCSLMVRWRAVNSAIANVYIGSYCGTVSAEMILSHSGRCLLQLVCAGQCRLTWWCGLRSVSAVAGRDVPTVTDKMTLMTLVGIFLNSQRVDSSLILNVIDSLHFLWSYWRQSGEGSAERVLPPKVESIAVLPVQLVLPMHRGTGSVVCVSAWLFSVTVSA